MNPTMKRVERALSAAVFAAFAAFWLTVFALSEPPEFRIMYLMTATVVAVLATLWIFAVRMLWRAWCTDRAAVLSTADGPALLLAASVAALPEDRRDWAAAMAAELAYVTGRSARWRFAGGCAWTALFPPRGSRVPLLVVGVLAVAAAAVTGPSVGRVMPEMRVFAVTFVAIVGALGTLATTRLGRWRLALSRLTIAVLGVAGVIACISSAAVFLWKNPDAAAHFSPLAAATFALLLAACLGLALAPPRALSASRLAPLLGAGAALTLAAGFVWAARISVHTMAGPIIWTLFAPLLVFFVVAAIGAAIGRSFAVGVQTTFWAALLSTLVVFTFALPEAMRRYALDGRTLSDGESGLAIGVNLKDAIWGLVQIPVFGFPFGVFGAALGSAISRRLPSQSPDQRRPVDDASALLRRSPPLGGAT